MAHVGKKLAFSMASCLGGLPGSLHFGFCLLAFRNITASADDSHDPSILVAQRNFCGQQPNLVSLAIQACHFAIEQRLSRSNDVLFVFVIGSCEFLWIVVEVGFP